MNYDFSCKCVKYSFLLLYLLKLFFFSFIIGPCHYLWNDKNEKHKGYYNKGERNIYIRCYFFFFFNFLDNFDCFKLPSRVKTIRLSVIIFSYNRLCVGKRGSLSIASIRYWNCLLNQQHALRRVSPNCTRSFVLKKDLGVRKSFTELQDGCQNVMVKRYRNGLAKNIQSCDLSFFHFLWSFYVHRFLTS